MENKVKFQHPRVAVLKKMYSIAKAEFKDVHAMSLQSCPTPRPYGL